MMRGLVLLCGFCLAAAGDDTTQCVFDGAEISSDLMDASLFIWAATKRCGHSGSDVVKCEIDVTSAMKSMNGVIDVILKVVNKCGSLDTENKKVGFAASHLTQAALKLAASIGKITEACPEAAPRRLTNMPINTAMCVVDVKGTFKHLIKAIHSLQHIKKECKHGGKKCAHNALAVVAAFGGLGEYVSGAIGDCAVADFGGKFGETSNGNANGLADLNLAVNPGCASGISSLVKALAKVSGAAVDLSIESKKAEPKAKIVVAAAPQVITVPVAVQVPPARLYDDEHDKDTATSSTNFVLGAFLPVTALVSFVGGRFYANRRVVGFEQVREMVTELE